MIGRVSRVAAKKFVSPFPGKDDLVSVFGNRLGKGEGTNIVRFADGAFGVPNHFGKVLQYSPRVELKFLAPEAKGGPARGRQ